MEDNSKWHLTPMASLLAWSRYFDSPLHPRRKAGEELSQVDKLEKGISERENL